MAQVVIERLATRPPESGLDGLEEMNAVLSPVTETEATRFSVPVGTPVARRFTRRVRRCLLATPAVLVEQQVLTSSEALAMVIPQITAQVSAAGFNDPDLRRLYGAIYRAFRRRRSLLLLNLQRQVQITELPWVKVIASDQDKGKTAREQARNTLTAVATLAVTAFPQQILPNKLLQELRALAKSAALEDAGSPIPIVDEVATDIFMGAFSPKFLHAAKIAGRLLAGTLYERYYGVSYARVQAINDAPPQPTSPKRQNIYAPPPTSPGFYKLCSELAERGGAAGTGTGGSWVARNGTIIEQEQILTTHNLATLFAVAGLTGRFHNRSVTNWRVAASRGFAVASYACRPRGGRVCRWSRTRRMPGGKWCSFCRSETTRTSMRSWRGRRSTWTRSPKPFASECARC